MGGDVCRSEGRLFFAAKNQLNLSLSAEQLVEIAQYRKSTDRGRAQQAKSLKRKGTFPHRSRSPFFYPPATMVGKDHDLLFHNRQS